MKHLFFENSLVQQAIIDLNFIGILYSLWDQINIISKINNIKITIMLKIKNLTLDCFQHISFFGNCEIQQRLVNENIYIKDILCHIISTAGGSGEVDNEITFNALEGINGLIYNLSHGLRQCPSQPQLLLSIKDQMEEQGTVEEYETWIFVESGVENRYMGVEAYIGMQSMVSYC
ncbi:MAG: hypothetical protein EZS28_003156 [Streblomastix strix]|uniref:Uncharacterized protein n=1 Tax=Streblomastix strix TaxID=222440 RepID=A0A5J4X3G6_9EUKA|nr:MAG: hypothetical protein EZS28_003156 [Streblomastix strix]